MGVSNKHQGHGHQKALGYDHESPDLDRSKRKPNQENPVDGLVVLNGKENSRNTNVAEIFVNPDCFDLLDDLLLFSIFNRTTVLREKGYGYGRAEHVKVMILVRDLVCWIMPIISVSHNNLCVMIILVDIIIP